MCDSYVYLYYGLGILMQQKWAFPMFLPSLCTLGKPFNLKVLDTRDIKSQRGGEAMRDSEAGLHQKRV